MAKGLEFRWKNQRNCAAVVAGDFFIRHWTEEVKAIFDAESLGARE
jgi:hypothetical protein